ncbi:Protein of unknown function (DUF620 [Striga hermonthica]|uniref:Uncharacterized protein n=1 Tax=Striga hermonthica TaxID=68872 RepID=A0A9N7R715_STRHE|nr:Protein of unknown function (DUF620 [Striga hermonthica]
MASRRKQRWCPQPLTPLMEGPDLEVEDVDDGAKKESSWEAIREWFGLHKNATSSFSSGYQRQDLRLLLGVLACPLAPIPIPSNPTFHLHIKDIPIETSAAYYIIQQYLAATGCSKHVGPTTRNMYASGMVKMVRCETEVSNGRGVRTVGGGSRSSGETGCFVLWRMSPDMWSLELSVGGTKVAAGSDGRTVWRHTPWLGVHAAKGPQRPLRRIIQVPNYDFFSFSTFFPIKFIIRSEGPAEVIRHVLYGYFSQRSGLLVYMEDSHLTRVHSTDDDDAVYWETTIGSGIGEYRDVDGVLIAHGGRTVATVFRFGETSAEHTRTRMEEVWRIRDVVFDVPGLSGDSFIPPADVFHPPPTTVSP